MKFSLSFYHSVFFCLGSAKGPKQLAADYAKYREDYFTLSTRKTITKETKTYREIINCEYEAVNTCTQS